MGSAGAFPKQRRRIAPFAKLKETKPNGFGRIVLREHSAGLSGAPGVSGVPRTGVRGSYSAARPSSKRYIRTISRSE